MSGSRPQDDYLKGTEWEDFVFTKIQRWFDHITEWSESKKPKLLVQYERLKNNSIGELSRILRFLNMTLTVKRRYCVLRDMEGKYHRQASEKVHFNPYTDTMHTFITEYIERANTLLRKAKEPLLVDSPHFKRPILK
ncbi:sialate:O-sulfotransferase 2-like [Saccoglossus kowalevskii]